MLVFLRRVLFCFNVCENYTHDESNWHQSRGLLAQKQIIFIILFSTFFRSIFINPRVISSYTCIHIYYTSANNFYNTYYSQWISFDLRTWFESLFEVAISCYSKKLRIECVCNMKCVYFPMFFHLQYIYNVIKL